MMKFLSGLFELFDGPLRVILLAIAVVTVISFCSGCATSHLSSREGQEVEAPAGFTVYCGTYPERKECGGDK